MKSNIAPVVNEEVRLKIDELCSERMRLLKGSESDPWKGNGFYKIFQSIQSLGFKRIYVSGAGTHTDSLWPMLQEVFGAVSGVIDRAPKSREYRSVPLLSREEYEPREGDAIILSSASFEEEMAAELSRIYGDRVKLIRLYSDDSWSRFCEEAALMKGSWIEEFDSLIGAMPSPEQGGLLNASGLGFAMGYDYSFIADRMFPEVSANHEDRERLTSIIGKSFERQRTEIAELCCGKKVFFVETYALGDHVVRPVFQIVDGVLDAGLCDIALVFITDQRTGDYFQNNPPKKNWVIVDWVMNPAVGYFLPELDSESVARLEALYSGLCPRLQDLYQASQVELSRGLRIAFSLYRVWFEKLISDLNPSFLLNVLDNRPASAGFYLLDRVKRVPVVQIQHGFHTTSLGPYWADLYLGWKDAHSKDQYTKTGTSFLAVGNFYLNYLYGLIRESGIQGEERDAAQRVFLFVFQGPPYWHVHHDRLRYSLEVIKAALPVLPKDWRIVIKLREEKGRQMLEDFFGELDRETRDRVSFELSRGEGFELYSKCDAVGVLSSSAREEAAYLGLPLISLEAEDSPACLSFAHYGMNMRVRDADEFCGLLASLPRREGRIQLDRSMEGNVGAAVEAIAALQLRKGKSPA